MHVVAAKAVAFKEAESNEFKQYQKQIIKNSQALAQYLKDSGFRIVSGGTDNHLFLIDLGSKGLTGKEAASILDEVHITVNKNLIPFDKKSPSLTSGLRFGTPAVTTRGMKEAEMKEIADIISKVLANKDNDAVIKDSSDSVAKLVKRFPLYSELSPKF